MKERAGVAIVIWSLIGGLGLLIAADEPEAERQAKQELLQLEQEWADAMVQRDTAKLGDILANDWEIIISSGEVRTKERVLNLLESGAMKLDFVEYVDMKVRAFGDTAVVTGRTIMKGRENNKDISGQERFTDVFVKKNRRWHCVATQTTSIAPKKARS